jgi:hypothetical protein
MYDVFFSQLLFLCSSLTQIKEISQFRWQMTALLCIGNHRAAKHNNAAVLNFVDSSYQMNYILCFTQLFKLSTCISKNCSN